MLGGRLDTRMVLPGQWILGNKVEDEGSCRIDTGL